jgi:hypothetical protein
VLLPALLTIGDYVTAPAEQNKRGGAEEGESGGDCVSVLLEKNTKEVEVWGDRMIESLG